MKYFPKHENINVHLAFFLIRAAPLANVPGPQATDPTYLLLALWAVAAALLFIWRPSSVRSSDNRSLPTEKPTPVMDNNQPPPPPPAL